MTTSAGGESDDMDKVLTSYFDKTVNSNTIKEKPMPSSELSKGDLLKILSYLEGEVQARDVVIATLKCERVKRLLADNKYTLTSDPYAALKRDSFATYVNSVDSKEDVELVRLWENQKLSVENILRKQRAAMKHIQTILADSEIMHRKMADELEEEKEKNASMKDGAKLKEELEIEKQLRARLEKELKETQDAHDEEKNKHKSIVLLLLTERKRILKQLVEERKRSADLLVMIEEEKRQALSMAEGLEEESQKALRMEAEIERQAAGFRIDRDRLTARVRIEEERRIETENQLKSLRSEVESLRKQLAEAHSVAMFQASIVNNSSSSSMGKKTSTVIRPTATVSSVPVAQPTTGIAKPVTGVQPPPVASQNSASVLSPVPNSVLQTKPSPSSEKSGGSLLAPKKYSLGPKPVPPPVPPNKPSVPHRSRFRSQFPGPEGGELMGHGLDYQRDSTKSSPSDLPESNEPSSTNIKLSTPSTNSILHHGQSEYPPKSGSLTAKIHAAKLEQQIT